MYKNMNLKGRTLLDATILPLLLPCSAMSTILKGLSILSCATFVLSSPLENATERVSPSGIDVSSWNTGISWSNVKSSGFAFAYIKATEGTSELNTDIILKPIYKLCHTQTTKALNSTGSISAPRM